MITGRPKTVVLYQDRDADCQNALRDGFLSLLRDAEKAGWSQIESAGALYDLVEEFISSGDTRSEVEIADMVNQESTAH